MNYPTLNFPCLNAYWHDYIQVIVRICCNCSCASAMARGAMVSSCCTMVSCALKILMTPSPSNSVSVHYVFFYDFSLRWRICNKSHILDPPNHQAMCPLWLHMESTTFHIMKYITFHLFGIVLSSLTCSTRQNENGIIIFIFTVTLMLLCYLLLHSDNRFNAHKFVHNRAKQLPC